MSWPKLSTPESARCLLEQIREKADRQAGLRERHRTRRAGDCLPAVRILTGSTATIGLFTSSPEEVMRLPQAIATA